MTEPEPTFHFVCTPAEARAFIEEHDRFDRSAVRHLPEVFDGAVG